MPSGPGLPGLPVRPCRGARGTLGAQAPRDAPAKASVRASGSSTGSRAAGAVAVPTWLAAPCSPRGYHPTALTLAPGRPGSPGRPASPGDPLGPTGPGEPRSPGGPWAGWERGQRLSQPQDISEGQGREPCHQRWQWHRTAFATMRGEVTNGGVPTALLRTEGRPGHLPWDQRCRQRQGNRGCREHPARDRRRSGR